MTSGDGLIVESPAPRVWDFVAIVGPTASGKSDLAMSMASALHGEIVVCDSVQVYRGFDIGSAKPTLNDRSLVAHHLLDVVSWPDPFDAASYAALANEAVGDIRQRGHLPIVVGGTGLYLRALQASAWHGDLPKDDNLRARLKQCSLVGLHDELERLDPDRCRQIHPHDRVRLERAVELCRLLDRPVSSLPPPPSGSRPRGFLIVIELPRPVLHEAIEKRTRSMLAAGLEAEVQHLLTTGCPTTAKPMQSIGYCQVCAMIQGRLERSGLVETISAATRQYAKRQCTWWRKWPADLIVGEPRGGLPADFPSLEQFGLGPLDQ